MTSGPQIPFTGHDARSVTFRARRKLQRLLKGARMRIMRSARQQYVFVAGMQRSGTNLVMDLLETSPITEVFHETDPRAFENYEMRERDVIRALVRESPAPVFVIKALCELDLLESLMGEFVPAKCIWIVRDWRTCAASANKSFGNFVPQWKRIAFDGGVEEWRARGMSSETRRLLQTLYHEGASEFEGAAIMWLYRNTLFFEQGFDRDERVRLVSYEGLIGDPERETAGICDFLGVRCDRDAMVARIGVPTTKAPASKASVEVERACAELQNRFSALIAGRRP